MSKGDVQKTGYKRTPVHSRFAKGTSGNPGGRPKQTVIDPDEDIIRLAETRFASGKRYIDVTREKIFQEGVKGHFPSAKYFAERYEKAKRRKGRTVYDDQADEMAAREVFGSDHSIFQEPVEEEIPLKVYRPGKGKTAEAEDTDEDPSDDEKDDG